MKLFKLDAELDSVIIGERIKGGIYRPCLETIPSSTIKGAFKSTLGIDVKGAGFFRKDTYEIREITYSIQDRYLGVAKIPITASCLYPKTGKIEAEIYIALEDSIRIDVFKSLKFSIGALKSKGFGRAEVKNVEDVNCDIRQGILKVRVLIEDASALHIEPISAVYGYLFNPENLVSGVYKKALFEGSLVKAPEVFLEEVTYYDE
jgi:hypothetical protein